MLSNRIQNMDESQTIRMAQLSRQLKAEGNDIISLSIGEPSFTTPEHVKKAAIMAINNNFSYYTAVSGIIELRVAIAKKLKKENGLDYSPEQIVVSTGAKQCIANIALCLLNPGDEVIIPTPYWVSYTEIVKLAGATPIFLETTLEEGFKMSPEKLRASITPTTKMIWYSSPCNPTGVIYSYEELKVIAEILQENPQLYVLSDEIYEFINYVGKHQSLAQFDKIKDRVIVVNGFSKGFAMTGWRVGYMAASLNIAKACDKMQGQFTSATCSIAQMAALEAISTDYSPTLKMRDVYRKRRDLSLAMLNKIKGIKTYVPDGAFYIFPTINYFFGKKWSDGTIKSASDLCMYLLKEALVATVDGEAFGNPDCIRLSFVVSEDELVEAFTRIKKALDKLQ